MNTQQLKAKYEGVLASEVGRMVVLSHTPVMTAAVNHSGLASFYVRAALDPMHPIEDARGFRVDNVKISGENYLRFTSTSPGTPFIFLHFVELLLHRIARVSSKREAVADLVSAIEEYRRFVDPRSGRLSDSEVRGIFGELMFIKLLLNSGLSAEATISSWRGPWSGLGIGLHDFRFLDGHGVEIKSTHLPATRIRVSSSEQLVPRQEPLDLVVLPLERAPEGSSLGVGFRELALQIGQVMQHAGSGVWSSWSDALVALRFDLGDTWYDRFRFVPGSWQRYKILEDFPHLDLPSLASEIVDVTYSLDLLRLARYGAPMKSLIAEVVRVD